MSVKVKALIYTKQATNYLLLNEHKNRHLSHSAILPFFATYVTAQACVISFICNTMTTEVMAHMSH